MSETESHLVEPEQQTDSDRQAINQIINIAYSKVSEVIKPLEVLCPMALVTPESVPGVGVTGAQFLRARQIINLLACVEYVILNF